MRIKPDAGAVPFAPRLMHHKPAATGLPWNAGMESPQLPPSPARRAALLRVEAAHAAWRLACEALLQAEVELWSDALRKAPAPPDPRLAEEAVRLRAATCACYEEVMEALRALDA